MTQKSFYIEDYIYQDLTRLAQMNKVPTAELMRQLIKAGIKGVKTKAKSGPDFLLRLAEYQLAGGPKDLAKHHDKYTWE